MASHDLPEGFSPHGKSEDEDKKVTPNYDLPPVYMGSHGTAARSKYEIPYAEYDTRAVMDYESSSNPYDANTEYIK